MSAKHAFKRLLLGTALPNEYVCLSSQKNFPLRIYWMRNGDGLDVTESQMLLGYKPLLLGLFLPKKDVSEIQKDDVIQLKVAEATTQDVYLASLQMAVRLTKDFGATTLLVLEGMSGKHLFLHPFQQLVNRVWLSLKAGKSGNVSLPGNLYDQVRIAYAIPRTIAAVTTSNGDRVNIFPTDLHGPLGDDHYVGSLRIGGKATEQVEVRKRIVLSELRPAFFREIYALGKNHMSDMTSRDQFQFHSLHTSMFGFPLPSGAINYRELEWVESLDIGIHRIHFYNVLHKAILENGYCLTHIHRYAAQWLLNRDMGQEMLFR